MALVKNNEKKVAVIFLGPFPVGNASTLRVFSYCKAMAKLGHKVKVFILAPTKEAAINSVHSGNYQGVDFENVTSITWSTPPSSLKKFAYYLYGIFKTILLIHKGGYNSILTYHNTLFLAFIIRIYSSIRMIPFVIDKTEYPYYYRTSGKLGKFIREINLKFFSGIITITKELESFYSKFNRTFLLPMTIDPNRYAGVERNKVDEDYIAVVVGSHDRDGVFDSIKVYNEYFKLIVNKKEVNNLYLIGDLTNKRDYNAILQFIQDRDLVSHIKMLGRVGGDEIPNLLINAKCLLSTPSSFPSGGFPTKLGEYLLSGVPVVMTIVGEVESYLKNGHDFLGDYPGNYLDLAKKILMLQEDPELAIRLGTNGKSTAMKNFNADNYVGELLNFIYKK
jgi:glycosyltransferase involved in cell wall biosynthesis